MSRIDLTSLEWCELIFKDKNKNYGAYKMRQDLGRRQLAALVIVTCAAVAALTLPRLIRMAMPEQKEEMVEVTQLSMLEEPEVKDENIVRKVEPIAPPPALKSTIKFTAPVVKKDEEVSDEDELKSQQELTETKVQISIADVKGNDELNGKDIADLKEVITQAPEEVKARHLDGSAYLDFPVNQITINPDYRNNSAELKKIQQTVEAVKNDPYATITSLSIKGYASPEGTYKGNAYLAENRAKALLNYVKEHYDLSGVELSVDFEPEDWEGLEAAVEKGNLPDKEELLAIIRADEPADWDAREWKLKTLNGGTSYKVLLRDVYPALRHSDYRVNYNIRNFTVDEAKQIIQSDPSKLSLNEMFLVAETYETGSEPFNEVFEIAVRMYPEDAVSNLNAAISAVNTRQLDKAKRYLAKANDCPEKQLAEASILMLEGKLDEAEKLLNLQAADPAIADAAQKNLDQINAKRKE